MSKEAMKLALEALDIAQGILADVKSHHQPKVLEAYTALREALAEQPAPVQGWKLVPVDPTKEMVDALADTDPERESVWDAVLAAAPQPAQQQEQEPVIWAISYDGKTPYAIWPDGDGALLDLEIKRQRGTASKMPLYTSPPAQRTWVWLTDKERNSLWREIIGWGDPSHDDEDLMKAIEDASRRKNA